MSYSTTDRRLERLQATVVVHSSKSRFSLDYFFLEKMSEKGFVVTSITFCYCRSVALLQAAPNNCNLDQLYHAFIIFSVILSTVDHENCLDKVVSWNLFIEAAAGFFGEKVAVCVEQKSRTTSCHLYPLIKLF